MKIEFTYHDIFEVEGNIDATWEGDNTIPNGTRDITEIEFFVYSAGSDITDYLSETTLDDIEEKLMEEARSSE